MPKWAKGERLRVSGGDHGAPTDYVVRSIEFPGEILEGLRLSGDQNIQEVRTLFDELGVFSVAWIYTAENGLTFHMAALLCADGCVRDAHKKLLTVEERE